MRGKKDWIGRDERIERKEEMEEEIWKEKVGILIIKMRIERIEGGLRNEKWKEKRGRVIDMEMKKKIVGMVEKREERIGNEERRNKILKNREGKRKKRKIKEKRKKKKEEIEKMIKRKIEIGNGKEDRKKRLRGKKVIEDLVKIVLMKEEKDGEKEELIEIKEEEMNIEGKMEREGGKIEKKIKKWVSIVLEDGIVGMRIEGIEKNERKLNGLGDGESLKIDVKLVNKKKDIGWEKRKVDSEEGWSLRIVIDGCKGKEEIRDELLKKEEKRKKEKEIVRDYGNSLIKNIVEVDDEVEIEMKIERRRLRKLLKRGRKSEKMKGKVEDIKGRKIKRENRVKSIGLIKVVEVEMIFINIVEREEGWLEKIKSLVEEDKEEIKRGNKGKKIEEDIGGRCEMRKDRGRVLMEIIRRKMVVLIIGELGKIEKGEERIEEKIRIVGGKKLKSIMRIGREDEEKWNKRRGKKDK